MGSAAFMLLDHTAHLTLAGYRPRTIRARREVVTSFATYIHPLALDSATRRHVEQFLSRPGLGPSSRHTYLNHLRGFYRWCAEEGLTSEDPTAKVGTIRVKPGTPRPLSPDDLTLAVDSAAPRMRAWLLLMSLAGLRCMEVAALQPRDILNVDGNVLLYLRECKGGGTATVPAHPAILEALAVLPLRNGAWWSVKANTVSTDVSHYLHSLGIGATAHSLRHTAGTAWYRASGHDLLTTARLLRHVQVSTSQVYAQLDPTRPAEVVNLVPFPGAYREAQ